VGRPKASTAAKRLRELNPLVDVHAIDDEFDERNGRRLVRDHDVVLDCTDRFAARYAINDACVLESRPDVSASIFRFEGTLSVFGVDGPCYRCLYPQPPAAAAGGCAEAGVVGSVAAVLGAWQANETLKILTRAGTPLYGRMLLFDGASSGVREIRFERDPECAVCGEHPEIHELHVAGDSTPEVAEVEVAELDDALRSALLLDIREPHEAVLGTIDGAIAIPFSQLESRLGELDMGREYVVACRIGVKSRWAAERLRSAGAQRVAHLRGGLLAYAAAQHASERIV
jgi:sulfur-carrier protein adenylyltransferase/sulfurtransferase